MDKTSEWWLDDLFVASSHPLLSRCIDHLVLKLGLARYTDDATSAFLHVLETEWVVVRPPKEWMDRRRSKGGSTEVCWRMKVQLYGRRRAGQALVSWLADRLVKDLGLTRSELAPQLFFDSSGAVYVEAHMDDLHIAGAPLEAKFLVEKLGKFLRMAHTAR